MEVLVVLGLLAGLALASVRWGYDSRAHLPSAEQRLAGLGVTWPAPPD